VGQITGILLYFTLGCVNEFLFMLPTFIIREIGDDIWYKIATHNAIQQGFTNCWCQVTAVTDFMLYRLIFVELAVHHHSDV